MNFPKLMAILNVTPNSFSDGIGETIENDKNYLEKCFQKAKKMIADGAEIIDIGGESTKPGSDEVPVNIELARVLPILKLLKTNFPNLPISIDTRKAEVAEESLKLGADIINDVSGLQFNPEIAEIVAKHKKELVIMHSKHSPKNMQNNPQYDDILAEIYSFLNEKIEFAKAKAVEKIYADIGIGFAKTTEHNLFLLKNLDYFDKLNVEFLLGISRKRFIGEITNIEIPAERDLATMLYHSLLLREKSNVKIIRIHNVSLAFQLKKIYQSLT
jgi:dihydropteroate synthase